MRLWHYTTSRAALSFFVLTFALQGIGMAQAEADPSDSLKLEYALIFPDEKNPELVRPDEENPFVSLTNLGLRENEGNSEENLVKDRILAMQVVGASQRENGYRVQLGDMILEPGMVVPSVLADQTVQLRVNSITEDAIEFVWMEVKRTGLPPRTLVMPIRIKPVVRYALPGQGRGGAGGGLAMGFVQKAPPPKSSGQSAASEPPPAPAAVAGGSAGASDNGGGAPPNAVSPVKSAADAVLDMFFNQGGIATPGK